ncbi:hypothetical protein TNCT_168621 [Trichonephila clavata]|uniref:Uncharacterized protein n=1 Tax=Trichonephila clavata TaxID=2740835 RepID=A0A8X6K5H0_TRICU|nr:hypothetical protein TNCT_168621 [Trichonephila clavata]
MDMTTFPQPPYSSNTASVDFFLFQRIKRSLNETRHGKLEVVMEEHALLDERAVDTSALPILPPEKLHPFN